MNRSKFVNVLVVGGTGMLRDAVLELARRSQVITVVARGRHRLSELTRREPNIRGIAVDYRDTTGFERALLSTTQGEISFDLAVVWVHDSAPSAPSQVARFVGTGYRPGRFFHVLSSAVADPASPARSKRSDFARIPNLSYHEVILGFVEDPSGARWLTHDEISGGVIEAIDAGAARFVVGTVRPWSVRP